MDVRECAWIPSLIAAVLFASIPLSAQDQCRDCLQSSIACDASLSGSLADGDCALADETLIDVYEFELVETGRVTIDLESSSFDAFLFLAEDSCAVLAIDNDGGNGRSSRIRADLLPGNYFVVANSLSAGGKGDYTLSITCEPIEFCSDCTVGSLQCGQSVSGTLAQGDCELRNFTFIDIYSFEMPVGGEIAITMSFGTLGFIVLYESGCVPIASNDACPAGPDPCLALGLPEGSYFIGINDVFRTSETRYRLEVSCASGSQVPGDCDQDGSLTISDGICLLSFLFLETSDRLPCGVGRETDPGNVALMGAAGDSAIGIDDAVAIFNHLFLAGDPHPLGRECVVIEGCQDTCVAP